MSLAEHIAAHAVIELGDRKLLCSCLWEPTDAPSWIAANAAHADHIAASWAEHRTVTTVLGGLDLPDGTVLRDVEGEVHLLHAPSPTPITLPATIIYHPEEDQ